MKQVDARGLSCPEPVIRTRKAMQNMNVGDEVEVLVETVTSRENVLRTVNALGCTATVEEIADGFKLLIHKP